MSGQDPRASLSLAAPCLGWIMAVAGILFSPSHDAFSAPSGESAPEESSVKALRTNHHDHAEGTVESMIPHQQHNGPHMRWTSLRPANALDAQRAEQIVQTLREASVKYKDYRMAIHDGYAPLHPERKQPHYHFANKQHRLMARLRFDPAEPTALLYTKTDQGYELEGAMYTAPRNMSEAQLNDRVPLSVAQWHAHINLCFPPEGSTRRMANKQFGFKGAIATEPECRQAGGRFVPQVGGWMIHVYPFKATPAEIWTH